MLPGRLIDGYRTFLKSRFASERTRYETLAERGQKPEVLVIGCCDSRVSPEVIFDADPGEMFVVRNVANLVPPYALDSTYHGTSAAIEFAVQVLKVKHIVVLGHAKCGGIHAFAGTGPDKLSPHGFLGRWMNILKPIEGTVPERPDYAAYLRDLELAAILNSLRNLATFPYVKVLAERGELELHGAYFGVATGDLMVLNRDTGVFEPVRIAAAV